MLKLTNKQHVQKQENEIIAYSKHNFDSWVNQFLGTPPSIEQILRYVIDLLRLDVEQLNKRKLIWYNMLRISCSIAIWPKVTAHKMICYTFKALNVRTKCGPIKWFLRSCARRNNNTIIELCKSICYWNESRTAAAQLTTHKPNDLRLIALVCVAVFDDFTVCHLTENKRKNCISMNDIRENRWLCLSNACR